MALYGAWPINQTATLLDGEDHYLVALAVASQDTAAFGELIRRHQSQVRNFLRRLAADPVEADDLAQEAFLHAWDKLHTYSGRGSFVGWLLKVAYTTFLQTKRKAKRYAEVIDEAGHAAQLESRSYAQDSDEVSDLDKLLAVLTQEERAILVMSYACGLSHREIGEATGSPVGTVKSVIYRAKEKIRTNFDIKDHQHG
ncbi:MAG: RNA polymerase sigma factor [Gammaproteobacteria bacterium]|nr:RNA polymerase sigma factor [Gammaproteobacteria bacterium]MDH3434877.1 RNA polymerase sigma factor [Gammaproteobacteria bacterium]